MKRIPFTDEQIIGILKGHEAGTPVSELCRKHGVSSFLAGNREWSLLSHSLTRWLASYGR